ncbi:MAG: 4Fe-4S binding protein [Cytophagales bacterium]|nr:4Fe-4S binding protein [Cytophagales bacterium]
MKIIKNIGLVIFLLGLSIFTFSGFLGEYTVDANNLSEILETNLSDRAKGNGLVEIYTEALSGKTFNNSFQISSIISSNYNEINEKLTAAQNWDKVMYDQPSSWTYKIIQSSPSGLFVDSKWLMFFLTFGLSIIGGIMFILPNFKLYGPEGIRHDGTFQGADTNRGWIGIITFIWLVGFYILLYFYPQHIVNQILTVDGVSRGLSGNGSSQWFLYGFMYCCVMTVMAIRMYIKYRHNLYQVIRTTSVLFFQIAFAFIIPDLLVRFQMPWFDFKNAWPLNYNFFTPGSINGLIESGGIGYFMLFWGILLTLVIVPVMVYFYGKRWYCSWVCGCGGLAETLGDPYRQLSDKSVKSWKIERWLIHGVLAFAILMTAIMLVKFFVPSFHFQYNVAGVDISPDGVKSAYGFLIGSIFSGVIGTGFYPVFGNRVWCRMGCPLAAYMGLVQRFKSRFRITTNGGQCISCGNCSTYCEQGIDVRWYAQRGQNIVRSSCVGCGVCSAVCPRGVLKLENGPEEGRINDNPIIIGKDNIELSKLPEIK